MEIKSKFLVENECLTFIGPMCVLTQSSPTAPTLTRPPPYIGVDLMIVLGRVRWKAPGQCDADKSNITVTY
jgi:hypothetical protein